MQSGPFGSNLRHSEFRCEGKLVLGIDNVGHGAFSLGSQNRISESKFAELAKYEARPGDLLITIMASLGRSCIVPDDLEEAIVTKHLYRISFERNMIVPAYVNLIVQGSPKFRSRMLEDARGQTRPGLNSEILRTLPIPLPSTAEQVCIVETVEAAFSEIEVMASELSATQRRVRALRQGVLNAAFAGKLVPQDPVDEPASVVLDRIRAERATAPAAAKRRGRRAALRS